ncbi:serine/threonine-protein kinase RIO3 [Trichinella spiralis]|uniref:serine/threonine-protein kinase RIO3 n=1 Tax=Trichinella spiralis TaxID=6334 RepID=UPI0001EFD376|nr:serine/threonine-protein kinase RIO3 [Trichinella spiralis]
MDANFVDYFSICGLNVDQELVEERLNDCSISSKPPLDRSYLPAVLAHYPKHRPDRPFAQEILSLCLPRGLRFCTQKNLTNKPSFHTFVCIRMDGSRLDGCALTFYEKVKDEKVMQKMQALHNTYLRELTAGKASDSTANVEDTPSRAKLMEENAGGNSAHTLPRRGKSSSKKRYSFYDSNHDKLYVCKCIALITKLPVVSACESLLTAIYSLTKESELQLPLESYVYWLLYELPLPPPGLSLKLTLLDRDIVFQCPKLYLLMLFAETFQILLFPFRWQHVYVPILPCSQFVFLEAPLPFIMGLWYEETIPENIFELKRISRSFDDDSLYVRDSRGDPASEQHIALPLNVLNESESLAKLTAIARKVHVDISLDLVKKELVSTSLYQLSPSCRYYFDHMKLNSLIRAVFLNRFMSTMYSYDHFIVNCCPDRDSFVSSRDSMQNFDKSTFLSDQPQSRMPFLAAFLETQMFTSFIDAKILAEWDQPDPFVKLFDNCLADYRRKNDDTIVRTPNCEFDPHLLLADMEIENRERNVDYVIPAPHLLTNSKNQCFSLAEPGTFPLLNADLLEPQPRQQNKNPWKQRYRHFIANDIGISQRTDSSDPAYQIIIHPGVELKVDDFTQKNSKVVEKLLLLAKTKTKRLLLEKLGKEAVQLGHDNSGIGGVEENTLVTSLCDMIERIWHHGCKRKKLLAGSSSPQSIIGYLQSVHNKLDADQKHWSNNLLRAANFFYFKLQSSVDNIPNVVCQCDVDVNAGGNRSPTRSRSSSSRRTPSHDHPKRRLQQIQHQLGDAVNNIVKYFYRPDAERNVLTHLLCGEKGLVSCLNEAFLLGYRGAPRLFRQSYFAWDFGSSVAICYIVDGTVFDHYHFPSLTFVGLGQLAGTVSIVCLWNAFRRKNGHLSFGSLKKLFPLPLIYLLNLLSGLGSTKTLNYRFNRSVKLAIFLMILGAIVAAVNDIYIDIIGCGYVLFNDLMTAANTICAKEKMNNVIIYFEFWKDWVFLLLFCCSCVGGYLLNMSTILCTHFNSPLATSCIGTIKNIFITYIGMVCTSDYAFSWPSFVGIHISLCGSLVYTIQAILPSCRSKMTWLSDSTHVYPAVRTC